VQTFSMPNPAELASSKAALQRLMCSAYALASSHEFSAMCDRLGQVSEAGG
jgi:hypothetical protein